MHRLWTHAQVMSMTHTQVMAFSDELIAEMERAPSDLGAVHFPAPVDFGAVHFPRPLNFGDAGATRVLSTPPWRQPSGKSHVHLPQMLSPGGSV